MHTRMLVAVSAALLMLGAHGARLDAQAAATVCKDGSTSTATGKGACSGHGGVDAKATAAAQKSAKADAKVATRSAKSEAKAAKTEAKSAGKTAKAEEKTEAKAPTRAKSEAKSNAATAKQQSSNRGEDKDPTGAIAQCKDGLYSHAASRRGACSKHGGVDKWLKQP